MSEISQPTELLEPIVDRSHRLARAEKIAAHWKMLGETFDFKQRLRGAADILDRFEQFDRAAYLGHGLSS